MQEKISCAFTGHRPQSFPWKYDETAQECLLLKATLTKEIEKLVDRGVTDFYSGLAEGVDTWSAEIALGLREKNPALSVHGVLPCRSQAIKWTPAAQEHHQWLQEQADTITCLSKEYYDGCMLDRNRYLVDHSDILLAVYNGSWRGGTAMTVRYAQKLGREIIVINPKTRLVTSFSNKI